MEQERVLTFSGWDDRLCRGTQNSGTPLSRFLSNIAASGSLCQHEIIHTVCAESGSLPPSPSCDSSCHYTTVLTRNDHEPYTLSRDSRFIGISWLVIPRIATNFIGHNYPRGYRTVRVSFRSRPDSASRSIVPRSLFVPCSPESSAAPITSIIRR